MVLIPAGEFILGSDPRQDKEAQSSEQPQHRFALPSFYLAKTPVTNAQYAAFVIDTGHIAPEHWRGGYPPDDREEHPVVAVFWHDAVAYCRWLAEVTGKPYRLPSEFEWEKGARGKDGRIYPWGNKWEPGRCNSKENGKGGVTPVNAYPAGASPYGLLDMAGNVLEWTRSLYKNYPNDPAHLWEDAESSGDIWPVLRGGAFIHNSSEMRCAVRRGASPYRWEYHLGFRVSLPPPP
jgi:formylglycine-generating enzyme required for sulfatase activity